ncbi:MAG: arginase family protein [Rhodococcus sp. (in: high G+C Gram-positive bacteria)]|uniref:arginase family protein n=1 Tax=Rhodococcus sp. TaxID=1831 RepID=UPI003BB4E0AD
MTDTNAPTTTPTTLRLVWPQWQGATRDMVAELTPGIPLDQARRGYAVGTAVLDAILPPHDGPSATVPVGMDDRGLEQRDGVDAKDTVVTQLNSAFRVIAEHPADKILTLGGECSVSVAPFTALADKYGDDLAVVWVDSHPDVGLPTSDYHGYHAMAVSTLLGHGDPDVVATLPATIPASRVALAGLHSWTDDDYPHVAEWGLTSFGPDTLRDSSDALLAWLSGTGCSRVAIHLDVDVVDSNEEIFGLGMEPDGLTTEQVRRLITDVARSAEVVGFTIAEYIPRQVLAVERLTAGLPLL